MITFLADTVFETSKLHILYSLLAAVVVLLSMAFGYLVSSIKNSDKIAFLEHDLESWKIQAELNSERAMEAMKIVSKQDEKETELEFLKQELYGRNDDDWQFIYSGA